MRSSPIQKLESSWVRLVRTCLAACLPALLAGCTAVRPCGTLELGPVVSRDRAPDGPRRVRAAGPFFEHQADAAGRTFTGVRPFYADTRDATRARRLQEFAWPLAIVKRFGKETHWRFLTGYGHDFDNTDPESANRHMIFPFLYWGRSRQGEDYLGLFPLYGDIREFLGRDRFLFFLFPLYGYHTVDDVETWEVLWPIVSRSRGEHVSRFRVWPFYGRSEKDEAYIKHFVLWPFWTHARFMYPAAQGTSWILFPFYGRTDMTDQQGWTVLPPFFRWSRSAQRRELSCPWPFVQYASGDEDKLYLWPLWGRREREGSRSGFAAWPFFHWRRLESGDRILERRFLLPFVYHERVLSPSETEATARYVKLWPLYDYRREGETMRLRLPTLWPLKQTGAIERNLAPLWTLFSHTRTGESVETELLWGLYRYRRDGAEERRVSLFPLMSTHRCGSGETERSGWSFLLGLLGREKEANESRWRFLWFF